MPNKNQTPEVIEGEIVNDAPSNGLARYAEPSRELMLTPVFNLNEAKNRLHELQEFVQHYMVEGEDYGVIPGTPKPTLLKSGADKLCDIYGLADSYTISSRTEDWSQGLFDYEVTCTLLSKRTGQLVGTGMGSCSSFESKYRWREMKRTCPQCGKATIIKGREEFGGGYVCWKKEGKSDGCGAKFSGDGAKAIAEQQVGRVANEDPADQKNTILKMAKKRAKVDAVLGVTRSSGLFTQDIEEWQTEAPATVEQPKAPPTPPPAPERKPEKANVPPATRAAANRSAEKAKPAPAPATAVPAGPPKAEIPKGFGARPSPAAPPAPAPAAPSQSRGPNGKRCDIIAAKCGCSTNNVSSCILRTLGISASEAKTTPPGRIVAVISALEMCLLEFPKDAAGVRKFICDEPGFDPNIKTYFNLAFTKLVS